jgi:hypothetical protein
MVVLKAVTLIAAGFLSLLAVRSLMHGMQAVKVKAGDRAARPQRVRRLRQDPRTGVYYPED